MFLRVVRAAGGKGVKHEYIRLVEAYRDGGKTRHRTIVNLGRKDLIAPHLDQLNRLVRGAPAPPADQDAAAPLQPIAALDWGPLLAVRQLWTELGLHDILDRLAGQRWGRDFSDRVLLLVANRLMQPSSEHGLARWLETSFACDRYGRRFLPAWRDDAERRASRGAR